MAGSVWAQTAQPHKAASSEELEERIGSAPDISDLVTYAYQNNPSIAASWYAWKAMTEKYRLATGYPDPQLMVTYFPEPIETRLGPQDWNASLSQQIPFPGKLTKIGETVKADAAMSRIRHDQRIRDVAIAVRKSFYELWYIRAARRVSTAQTELLGHMRKVAETAHADNRIQLLDVVKTQAQVGQLRYDELLLQELEAKEITRLNALLNRSPDSPIGTLRVTPLASLETPVAELMKMAEGGRDEVRLANAAVSKADAAKELAKVQNYPNFKLGFFYAGIGDPDSGTMAPPEDAGRDAVGIQFGLSIPLWWDKNSGREAKAVADRSRAAAMRSARINETRSMLHNIFFKLKTSERLVALYRDELLPQATSSIETAETWFRQGEGSFSDFIEAQAVLYNFQLALYRARADYGKALADLEGVIGQPAIGERAQL
jgi:outer membrane protein TolC